MGVNSDISTMKMYCSDITSIENYDKAIADSQCWELHHRLETHDENGNERSKPLTQQELKKLGLFYHRPASEFIFLTKKDHMSLHQRLRMQNYDMTETHRQRLLESREGLRWFTNGVTETKAFECPEGYRAGRLPKTHDLKLRLSKHFSKAKWWTNGEIDRFSIECLEGFYSGRSATRKKVG